MRWFSSIILAAHVRIGHPLDPDFCAAMQVVNQEYVICRDSTRKHFDVVFDVDTYRETVAPKCSFEFTLIYSPCIPFVTNYDSFIVYCDTELCLFIATKGISIGPNVQPSVTNLKFFITPTRKQQVKTVKLENKSSVVALYQFMNDNRYSVFKVNPTHGYIKPYSKVSATITLVPKKPGIYSKTLYCLVLNQTPIDIYLEALCPFLEGTSLNAIHFFTCPLYGIPTGGFEHFMSDISFVTKKPPPLSLSRTDLDFGTVLVDNPSPTAIYVCCSNHTQGDIKLIWNKDESSVFLIDPLVTNIRSNAVAKFFVYFRPDKNDKIYDLELEAYCICLTCAATHADPFVIHFPVPYFLKLNLLGNSFTTSKYNNDVLVEISPERIIMPACVPPYPVYATFYIKRIGPDPVMFDFTPPPVRYYVVKPRQGVIYEEFQIVVAQLCPIESNKAEYSEKWTLEINGSNENQVTMEFCGYAEYPSVIVGTDDKVNFPKTYPGCWQQVHIPVKNVTRHCIRYNFLVVENPDMMSIDEPYGTISPNEILYMSWKFHPDSVGDHKATVKCEVYALHECKYQIGEIFEKNIAVTGSSETNSLVALPNQINMGITEWGKPMHNKFTIFNFGSCYMHYTLLTHGCQHDDYPSDIIFSPNCGTLGPKDSNTIGITINCKNVGSRSVEVFYKLRKEAGSTEEVTKHAESLALLNIVCIISKLKVKDILCREHGNLYSKVSLWEILNIDSLNYIFETMQPESQQFVRIQLPHKIIDSPPFILKILLRNESEISLDWSIKRKRNCNCKLISYNPGISIRAYKYDCNHKDLITLSPTSGELKSKDTVVINLQVNYTLVGHTDFLYHLKLPNDRTVVVTFALVVYPLDYKQVTLYQSKITLDSTFIGALNPSMEIMWLYNVTNNLITYCLQTNLLESLQKSNYGAEVIKCLNPTDSIAANSFHPLLFVFKPLQFVTYEISLPFTMEDDKTYLMLIGEGTIIKKVPTKPFLKMPNLRKFSTADYQIELSIDHIILEPFPTHSDTQTIFFMNNLSSDTIFGYEWDEIQIDNILSVEVTPSHGRLYPQCTQCFLLRVQSSAIATKLSVPLCCTVVNITQRSEHNKSVVKFREVEAVMEEFFTITEEGETQPKCTLPIQPAPKDIHLVTAVTCYIVPGTEVDNAIPLNKQLKLNPACAWSWSISDHSSVFIPVTVERKHVEVAKYILGRVIWDCLLGQKFYRRISQIQSERTPFFSQFKMDDELEANLTKTSCRLPPRDAVAKIFRNIILEVLHDTFNLGSAAVGEKGFDYKSKLRPSSSLISESSVSTVLFSDRRLKVPNGK